MHPGLEHRIDELCTVCDANVPQALTCTCGDEGTLTPSDYPDAS